MKKIKNKSIIFSISLIIVGSFLEIYYYSFRFTQDGISIWLSIIIGIALTLLLSLAVYKRKNKIMWAIIAPLIFYSILATSAGQSFSLGIHEEARLEAEAKEQYTQDEIKEIQDRINYIDLEITKINEQISNSIVDLEDRWEYTNTLGRAEKRIDELNDERKSLRIELNNKRAIAQTHSDVEESIINIYEFYHRLFGWNKRSFQFILQTILSAFIAAMSPIGIITLGRKKRKYDRVIPTDRTSKLKGLIILWVNTNWMGKRSGRTDTIIPKNVFDAYLKKNDKKISLLNYNTLIKTSRSLGILDGDKIIDDERTAVKKLVDRLCKT